MSNNTNTKARATKAAGIVVKAASADALKAVIAAFATDDATELSRIAVVQSFILGGESIRGAVAAVTKANGGRPVRGFTKSTVGRYFQIAAQLDRDDAPKTSDAQYRRVAIALVNLANVGANLASVTDLAIKGSKTGAEYAGAITKAATEAGKAEYRALTAPKSPTRPTGGETANGGKAPQVTTSNADTKVSDVKAALAGHGTGALIAELTRRYSVKGASVLSDDVDALTALLARVESLIESGAIVKA